MDLSPILARLKTQLVGLKSVGASADLDAAIEGTVAVPSAFVLPLGESATPSELTMVTRQRMTHSFGVVHVVTNRRDAQGAQALVDLATLREQLKAALIGWVMVAASGEPVQFTGGRLLSLDGNGRLWWVDEFVFLSTYRSN